MTFEMWSLIGLLLILVMSPSISLLSPAPNKRYSPVVLSLYSLHPSLLSTPSEVLLSVITEENLSPGDTFTPVVDPGASFVSGGILVGFFIVQSRISQANKLLGIIDSKKGQIQILKAKILSEKDAVAIVEERDSLQREVDSLEEEFLRCITFLDIPNGPVLRFRIQQPESQLTEQQRRERAREKIEESAQNLNRNIHLKRGDRLGNEAEDEKGLVVPSFEKSTPFQRVLLFVGLILVSSLSSLLITLMSDPMSSTVENYVEPSSERVYHGPN